MEFTAGEFYHVYNRGNDSGKTFFRPENYLFFLWKVRKELLQYCDILAYCLMPNHYHLLVHVKEPAEPFTGQTAQSGRTGPPAADTTRIMHPLARKIGTLQSSIHKLSISNSIEGVHFFNKKPRPNFWRNTLLNAFIISTKIL